MWNEANPRAPRPADYKKKPSRVEESDKNVGHEAEKVKKHEKNSENLVKAEGHSEKVKHSDEREGKKSDREEKKSERDVQSRESKKLNTSHLSDTSGIASLPDDHDEAANKYVENLLENVQKHIIAST